MVSIRILIGLAIESAMDPSQAGKYNLRLAIKTCLEIKLNPRLAGQADNRDYMKLIPIYIS